MVQEHELEILRRPDRLALVRVVANPFGALQEDGRRPEEHEQSE